MNRALHHAIAAIGLCLTAILTCAAADKKTYDKSIQTLHTAVEKAKLGQREQVEALKRLTLWSDNELRG